MSAKIVCLNKRVESFPVVLQYSASNGCEIAGHFVVFFAPILHVIHRLAMTFRLLKKFRRQQKSRIRLEKSLFYQFHGIRLIDFKQTFTSFKGDYRYILQGYGKGSNPGIQRIIQCQLNLSFVRLFFDCFCHFGTHSNIQTVRPITKTLYILLPTTRNF